ncbi:MAG TPA: hypothetical protein VF553_02455 [Pyrinomonadaceae bacterium]|jgi:hypothetical protein
MNNISTWLQWALPFLAFVIAIVAFIANFKDTIRKFKDGDSATILLVLVTFLCASLGVERFVNADQIDKRLSSTESKLSDIEVRVSSPLGGRLLNNYNEIYRSGAKLCSLADEQIRAVVVSPGPKAPPYFIDAVIQRLKERKQAGYAVKYYVVLVLDDNQITDLASLEKSNNERLALFERNGIRDSIKLFVLDAKPPLIFDLLVVDRKHVNIGITPTKEGKSLENAIIFENQPQMASKMADWFDGYILQIAKPYEEWLKEQQSKRHT